MLRAFIRLVDREDERTIQQGNVVGVHMLSRSLHAPHSNIYSEQRQQVCLLGIAPRPGEVAWAILCKTNAYCKCA